MAGETRRTTKGSPLAPATRVGCPALGGCGGVADCLHCRWYGGSYGSARMTSVRCELDRALRLGTRIVDVPGRFLG